MDAEQFLLKACDYFSNRAEMFSKLSNDCLRVGDEQMAHRYLDDALEYIKAISYIHDWLDD